MHKAPFMFPIVGGRKVEHMLANIEALNISLTPTQIKYIESALPFDLGFPSNLVVRLSPSGREIRQLTVVVSFIRDNSVTRRISSS